jgi:hypothetical protein
LRQKGYKLEGVRATIFSLLLEGFSGLGFISILSQFTVVIYIVVKSHNIYKKILPINCEMLETSDLLFRFQSFVFFVQRQVLYNSLPTFSA